jgi:hypothetical protein
MMKRYITCEGKGGFEKERFCYSAFGIWDWVCNRRYQGLEYGAFYVFLELDKWKVQPAILNAIFESSLRSLVAIFVFDQSCCCL